MGKLYNLLAVARLIRPLYCRTRILKRDRIPRVGNHDAFVPAAPKTVSDSSNDQLPDPFAAAAMVNGGEITQKSSPADEKGRPSLFERVTRTGRAAPGRKSDNLISGDTKSVLDNTINDPTDLASVASPSGNQHESDINSVSNNADNDDTTGKLSEQSEISDLGLVEMRTPDEDDLLDIPAFLRRQAN